MHLPQNTWKKERTWIETALSGTSRISHHKSRLSGIKEPIKKGDGKEMESLHLSQNADSTAKVTSTLKTPENIGSQAVSQCLLSVQSQNKEYFPNSRGPLQYGECIYKLCVPRGSWELTWGCLSRNFCMIKTMFMKMYPLLLGRETEIDCCHAVACEIHFILFFLFICAC